MEGREYVCVKMELPTAPPFRWVYLQRAESRFPNSVLRAPRAAKPDRNGFLTGKSGDRRNAQGGHGRIYRNWVPESRERCLP